MHELSLAGNILRIVESAAQQDAFVRVRTLHLSVPVLAGVEVGALRFALESLAPRTLLDGAHLTIDEPASQAHCLECARDITVEDHGAPCPSCGSECWQLSGDRGVRVVELLVE
ncbi:MAG: hydrogenase maturation nickel metallochaperone HypA [Granulosicoccus sp.]|nr:hydrogenase maturation nickel metallochaperone HypA [Granulosicoccus sp.]